MHQRVDSLRLARVFPTQRRVGMAGEAARRLGLSGGFERAERVGQDGGDRLLGALGFVAGIGHWGYGSGWVDGSIGMFVVALALGGRGGQRPTQARRLAAELAEQNEPITSS